MRSHCGRVSAMAAAWLALGFAPAAQTPATPPAPDFDAFLTELHAAAIAPETQPFLDLVAEGADREAAAAFALESLVPGVTTASVHARLWTPLDDAPPGDGYRVLVELFLELGEIGRLETWQLDLVREAQPRTQADAGRWRIAAQQSIDSISGLYHLTLDPTKQYTARDLVITGEDLTLRLDNGSVFVAEAENGVTALVLMGDGVMTFEPEPDAEKRQIEIFSGSQVLEAAFTEAFVRLHPDIFSGRVSSAALEEREVNAGDLRRATMIFDAFVTQTFNLDLGDLSTKTWSLLPAVGDFLAELRTRRHGTLTYAQAGSQPEDVTLYERATSRVFSIYPSARKRAVQGRYFSDDEAVSYDVLDYHIAASLEPAGVSRESLRADPELIGCRIQGTTRLAIRVTALAVTAVTLRFADALDVLSVTSPELGPLLFFRLRDQNNLIVNLPAEIPIGTELTFTIAYSGMLPAQDLDENWIGVQRLAFEGDVPFGIGEPRYVYSNSSYWYPQSIVTDYATATMELTVPADFGVIASGEPAAANPPLASALSSIGTRTYSFVTLQPARYLSTVISRFTTVDSQPQQVLLSGEAATVLKTDRAGVYYDALTVWVETNPRSVGQVAAVHGQATEILNFYASLVGDLPYPTFTLAMTDSRLPGGHSPAYFAVLNQPLPTHPGLILSWRTDPVSFSGYPSFFLAHELAHQWWGQAVGWKNYHEQWLSEGLSQYFAALNAEREGGPTIFADVLAQMRDWSERHSGEGPIYLGYRLGHIQSDPRVFRALVYNKGAMVLHMLRRLIGDEAFFDGLRRFYADHRFTKAGTDDLIAAFESTAGRSLETFFERWIHEAEIPLLDFSSEASANDVLLRFEQGEKIFEVPVTVTINYRSGETEQVIVRVTEQVTELRHPLKGPLRGIEVNQDNAALVDIRR